MRIQYVSFFSENDPAEQPLSDYLADLENEAETELVVSEIRNVEEWKPKLLSLELDKLDILMIGCHGHASLTAFCIGNEPVRWHELAFALKDSLPASCSFIFYSCNGGYPGIAHMLFGSGGPDFLFGPYNQVYADAMTHSVQQIVEWKRRGFSTAGEARRLVNDVNEWAKDRYPDSEYDQSFLRVQWREGRKSSRHPTEPGPDTPSLPPVSLKAAL